MQYCLPLLPESSRSMLVLLQMQELLVVLELLELLELPVPELQEFILLLELLLLPKHASVATSVGAASGARADRVATARAGTAASAA